MDHWFNVKNVIQSEGVDYLFARLRNIFEDGHIVFGNLEEPLSDNKTEKDIKALFFRADPYVIEGLKNANFFVLSVTNNHIVEHGEMAFWSTVICHMENGIRPVGVENSTEVLEIENSKIAVTAYSFMEDYRSNVRYNKLAKSSKSLSPPQADGVLQNFAPSGTDFGKTWNPRSLATWYSI